MFSHCLQSGNSIELYNGHKKELINNWKFTGKHTKIYDNTIKNYMHILDLGTLSKMEIPPSNKQTLGIFQSYIVFQIYLFTTKQFSIEIAISDTTKTKRRLIFSTNNRDIVINQLHCRIPILQFPIGTWVNFSIDILSFISKIFKDLTFRSVDSICFSASGKVREIFSMRNQLQNTLDDDPNGESVPSKFNLPSNVVVDNINMNVNRVITQMTIENRIGLIPLQHSPSMGQNETYGYQNYQTKQIYVNTNTVGNNNSRSISNVNIVGNENTTTLTNSISYSPGSDGKNNRNQGDYVQGSYKPFNKEEYQKRIKDEKERSLSKEKKSNKDNIKTVVKTNAKSPIFNPYVNNKPRPNVNDKKGSQRKGMVSNTESNRLYVYDNAFENNFNDNNDQNQPDLNEDLYEMGHGDNMNMIMNQISTIKNENAEDKDDSAPIFNNYSPQISDNNQQQHYQHDLEDDHEDKKKIVAEILEDSSHCIFNKDSINRPFSPPINQAQDI